MGCGRVGASLARSLEAAGHEVAIIDPGPDDPRHRAAILAAVGQARVAAILVTHAHLDHSGGARALTEAAVAALEPYGEAAGNLRALARFVIDRQT